MKAKILFVLMLLTVTTVGVSAQSLEGTWRQKESNANPLREGYTQIKLITNNHFVWFVADKEGNIISGAGGTISINGDQYEETLLYTLPGMSAWTGGKAVYKYKFENGLLSIKGTLGYKTGKVEISEVWEKIVETK